MPTLTPQDPNFESRVRRSFDRQQIMHTIDARLTRVAPGEVDIELPFNPSLTQQHGFLHAGIVSTIADSACGYAALTLMPARAAVLTVEFKINLMAPAIGDRLIAEGRVTRAGRTLTVCHGDVYAEREDKRRLVATIIATMMQMTDREGMRD